MPRLSKIGAAALAAFGWTGASSVTASYLVVAGGGSGGSFIGGGGGAGGMLTGSALLNSTLSYTVTVGAGGSPDSQGSNSVFNAVTSTGGGKGGVYDAGTGGAGGSGGGGAGTSGTTSSSSGGSGTSGQGNAGGNTSGATSGGSGGGGKTNAGGSASNGNGANGGDGAYSSISGSAIVYAGGGGGGARTLDTGTGGTGGAGGGGRGGGPSGTGQATSGTANLGGGGGGYGFLSSGGSAGSGGSGVVIISYPAPQKFGGGIVTTSGSNVIHTFTTSGILSPLSSLTTSALIVAGGGSSTGAGSTGGGGGAGGMQTPTGIIIDTNSTYLVTVGAGGTVQSSGNNSLFSAYATASVGGGYGGSNGSNGANGGSGGGGGSGTGQTFGGSGTSGQGNAGGQNNNSAAPNYGAGGGGGAGAVGSNGNSSVGGNGGVGLTSSISGTSTYYAGGGGGGTYGGGTLGVGGLGGGGSATGNTATASGTPNTGGGGGGAINNAGGGGNGGSGIIIISYAGTTQQMAGGTVTISGGNVIHTFTSSGYLTPLKFVGNSLRFRSSASAYLNRTPSVASNRTTWTWSAWVKRGALGGGGGLFCAGTAGTDDTFIGFNSNDTFGWFNRNSSSVNSQLTTTQVFRDPAAWYNIVVVWNTTNGTSSNRMMIYVNGVQITSFTTTTYPSSSQTSNTNNNVATYIGQQLTSGNFFDGYMTEINFIDGQALTPNSFGTFNSYGVWQPITYGGSYGTNGFYLPFNHGTASYYGSFNGSSQYLTWTSNMAGLQFGTGDFTLEAWVNKSGNGTNGYDGLMEYGSAGGGADGWYFEVSSSRGIYFVIGNTTPINYTTWTNDGYWHHVAIVRSSGTVTIYKDGIALLSQSITTSVPTSGAVGRIGESYNGTTNYYFNGQISNARIVKGTALYTGNFVPSTTPLTAVTGTQILTCQNSTFIDNSSNATTLTNNGTATTAYAYPLSTTAFQDQGPAGNNWTPNNIGVLAGSNLDYMTDVPTLTSATAANYCTWNPLNVSGYSATSTLTNGNLTTSQSSTYVLSTGTIGVSSGKWYWEVTGFSGSYPQVGVTNVATPQQSFDTANTWMYTGSNGNKVNNNSSVAYGATFGSSDVIGVALDMNAGTLTFYKNNTSQGVAYTTGLLGLTLCPSFASGYLTAGCSVNFGQQPFVYTPPSGFVALNTYNL